MSKLRANQIVNKASTGAPTAPNGLVVTGVSTATSFSGSGANLTSIPAGQLTGTVADARISTLTASKLTGALPAISGANLTGITSKILDIKTVRHTTSTSFNVSSTNLAGANVFYFPYNGNAILQINYARTNSSSSIILQGHYSVDTSTNSHAMYAFIEQDTSIRKNLAIDEHNADRQYLNTPFFCMFTSAELGSSANVGVSRTYTVAIGAGNNRTHTGTRCPNMHGSYSDTSNAPHYSEITLMEVLAS
tara:strand:+ start:192 stop:938 length:747 start_codon:yes stop_codon:yes gene_type:complete